ncbi:Trichome birefringence-like family [Parasponia andersonii]|uniref:Trichome birefringence-like family n=1 Tax=Parasponia andersonii TaxID=3476 RepID=A0A2P5E0P1_PARAD|nr:Trichome birefringence-like family [Parasponia andersonii]
MKPPMMSSPLFFSSLLTKSLQLLLYLISFKCIFGHQLQLHHNTDPSLSQTEEIEKIPFAIGRTKEGCDIFSGRWVWDESRPLYEESDCPFIHQKLICLQHGRPEKKYQHWKWQPHDCDLPRSIDWGGEPGRNCYNETTMIEDPNYWGSDCRKSLMQVLGEELSDSNFLITLLNITQLTSYRKDAHPGIYRKFFGPLPPDEPTNPMKYADCIHWCLPGVQDNWNELFFTKLFYP